MDGKNVTKNLFFAQQTERKNKQYVRLNISIVSCDVADVIRTSQEYDIIAKEWYGNDEDWGV